MNSAPDLNKRLLKLYPVKVVKNYFNPEESVQSEMIPEIVNAQSAQAIKQFATDYHNYTKQHIYFFELSANFNRPNFNLNNFELSLEGETIVNGGYNFKFLPQAEYNVVLGGPTEETVLSFYQPMTVRVHGRKLIVYITILEKNLESYFGNRRVYEAKKANDDDYFVTLIVDYFKNFYGVTPLDLNRGIKKLWADDVIDSKYAKWKKSHSTTTENMDEEFTLKQKYPPLYEEITKAPINRTIFKNISGHSDINSHFSIDPSKGLLTISIYPEDLDQTNNVINKILAGN